MRKCLAFSNSYNRLNIFQKSLQKFDDIQFVFIDDIKLLTDLLAKSSQSSTLSLIIDFEHENIKNIRDFAYDCIKFNKNIKCILLPAKRFNISHQKIGLVHFVKKGKVVSSFDELIADLNEVLK